MTESPSDVREWLARSASSPYAYLTTTGRRTGRPHRIEIWFAAVDDYILLLSGGRDRSDWVRNLKVNPQVVVELGDETRTGVARVLEPGVPEDTLARELLVAKYRKGDNLDEWARRSLACIIKFAVDREPPDR